MYTMITIDNVFSREDGERKVNKLKEITKNNYHNFEYGVCPIGGSFDITVTSNYEFESNDPQKEMMEVFLFILASRI